jgi:hypothetical protein
MEDAMSSGGRSLSEEELSLLAVASTCNCDCDRDRDRDSWLKPPWTSPIKESRYIGGTVAGGVEIASIVPMRNNSTYSE